MRMMMISSVIKVILRIMLLRIMLFHHNFHCFSSELSMFLGLLIIIWLNACNENMKLSYVRICRTLVTNRAAARERKCPDVRICRTVHTNHEIAKNKKWPHIRICRTFGTNRYSRDSGDPLMPPCGPQEWQNPLDCWSNFNHQENEACGKGWWRARYFEW